MIDNGRSPALLPSERLIVAAPMSLEASILAYLAYQFARNPAGTPERCQS
jgi:hypothetical protein